MRKLRYVIIALVSICFIATPVSAAPKGNRKIQSFTKAKRILMREIYRGHQKTFYCGSGKFTAAIRKPFIAAPSIPRGNM
jgi:hypothetical protein